MKRLALRHCIFILPLVTPIAFAAGADAPKGKPTEPSGVVQMSEEQQKTIQLKMESATRLPIFEPVRVPGTVGFDPGHVALLRPLGQARILRLLVQPGDVVAAGQSLAELDMPGLATLEENLAAGKAALHEAEAGVAVARDALRRGELLARDGSLSQAEAERRRLLLAQAVAAAETARAKVKASRVEVDRLNPQGRPGVASLVSPIAGIVVAVGVTAGEVLDPAREAFTVADLSTVQVVAQVPEDSASQVAVNDAAVVSMTVGNRHWDGRIATLGAALDPQARTLPARLRIANLDLTLRIGMFVNVTITHATGRYAIVIPSAAVQAVADKQIVFTPLGGGRFQSHDVTVGMERQDLVELHDGLTEGDQVVTHGSFELKALLQKSMLGGG